MIGDYCIEKYFFEQYFVGKICFVFLNTFAKNTHKVKYVSGKM